MLDNVNCETLTAELLLLLVFNQSTITQSCCWIRTYYRHDAFSCCPTNIM